MDGVMGDGWITRDGELPGGWVLRGAELREEYPPGSPWHVRGQELTDGCEPDGGPRAG